MSSGDNSSKRDTRVLKNVHLHYLTTKKDDEGTRPVLEDIVVDLYRVQLRLEDRDTFIRQIQALVDKYRVP